MLIALMARDKPGHLQTRKDNRDAHLAYIEATGVVTQAGPLLDEAGEPGPTPIPMPRPGCSRTSP